MKLIRRQRQPVARTSVALPSELYDAGRALARRDLRSFSNYLAALIADDVRVRGQIIQEGGK